MTRHNHSMSVLVISKGNSAETSFKPFDTIPVHSYSGCGCVGAGPTQITMKTTLLEKYSASSQLLASSSQAATAIPQLFLRQPFLYPAKHRGILKNQAKGTENIPTKKQVSFADTIGKELTQVKEIPNLSIFEQSVDDELNLLINPITDEIPRQSISPVPTLKQVERKNKWSYAKPDCIEKMHEHMVALQEIKLENNIFKGKVRVMNINFEKTITIRWTKDNWKNSFNSSAKYFEDKWNKNHNSDSFLFHLPCISGCIEFAIQYKTATQEYWDNNEGRNYQIRISQA